MGVTGLHNFLKTYNGGIFLIKHSLKDIRNQIQAYEEQHGKKPKILINVRAFNNYFEPSLYDGNFGCRFNVIKNDFEMLLEALKSAGAELIFLARKRNLSVKEESIKSAYSNGITTLASLDNKCSQFLKYPWQEISIQVLKQSAQKFGNFVPLDPFTMKQCANHGKIAKEENAYAIFGLESYYLFHEGDWKFMYPHRDSRSSEAVFMEYNKPKILETFNFSLEQFRVFNLLAKSFISKRDDYDNHQKLSEYFMITERNGQAHKDFPRIIDFVHRYLPIEKFPLQNETIDEVMTEIFGDSYNEQIRNWFMEKMNFEPTHFDEFGVKFYDDEINDLLAANPFSSLAECVLNAFPCVIASPFLDVNLNDLMSLKDLTKGWFKRFSGILLKHTDIPKTFVVTYHVQSEKLESFDVEPESPQFDIPKLKGLITGDMDAKTKFKLLSFVVGNYLSEEDWQEIPEEYLMHVIITTHMIRHNSMTLHEAHAITKAIMKSGELRLGGKYPNKVNVRAFRVSAIYEELFGVLLMILSALGMKEFISEFKLDNVRYQKVLSEILGWSRGGGDGDPNNNINIPQFIMKIIFDK